MEMKIATINLYGQTGMNPSKLLELEYFIECHKLDIVCLQETNISENTFSECRFITSSRLHIIINNSSTNYGTYILLKKTFSISNISKDPYGRFISVDVDSKFTVANAYLHSGTDQKSRIDRESFISDIIPNLMLCKKQAGFLCGDFNSIVEKKDSLVHPDQKLSKCFKKLIDLYKLRDVFRQLYPSAVHFSRYYNWRGIRGATRLDKIYEWGAVSV